MVILAWRERHTPHFSMGSPLIHRIAMRWVVFPFRAELGLAKEFLFNRVCGERK